MLAASCIQGTLLYFKWTEEGVLYISRDQSYKQEIMVYRIVPNKRAGRVSRKRTLRPIQFQWNLQAELMYTYSLRGKNLIEVG